jgi:hypothetical protein
MVIAPYFVARPPKLEQLRQPGHRVRLVAKPEIRVREAEGAAVEQSPRSRRARLTGVRVEGHSERMRCDEIPVVCPFL